MSTLTYYRTPLRRNTSSWLDSFFRLTSDTNYPTAKVNETEETYNISLIAPGLSNEDFNVSLDGTTLSVSCEAQEGEGYSPMTYSSFTKSWTVPRGTTEKDVQAHYKSGVLTLVVNKLASDAPTSKSIPVS